MEYAFGSFDHNAHALRARTGKRLVRSVLEPTRRLCVSWPAKGGRGAEVDRRVSGDKSDEYARLVEAIRNGDSRAETELIRRFLQGVLFKLRKDTGDPALADDLHQDTFQLVLIKLRAGELRSPAALPAFIRKIAHNLMIEHFRKAKRRGENPDSEMIDRIRDEKKGPFQVLSEQQQAEAVRQLIDELPTERDRDIITRYYFLKQIKKEICRVWDLPSDHFDRVIHRARFRLKQIILLKYPHLFDKDSDDDDDE